MPPPRKSRSRQAGSSFLDGLPELRDTLAADAQAAYEGDPAATSPLEVVLCYPGLDAVFAYRVAHDDW